MSRKYLGRVIFLGVVLIALLLGSLPRAWAQDTWVAQEKMSLQDAAKNVGMSKKTLDEYFNQIKEGKKYGFD
ncbi:MAG: hypothetical protein II651_03065, partial [Selenomonas sp.]|nr:hypothetical protein [Selenomonas sp.]